MTEAHHRRDLPDRTMVPTGTLSAGMPGALGAAWPGTTGVSSMRCCGPCARDLPPDCGDWKNTHRRFCRWRDKGVWESLLEQFMDEPDYAWLMIDASHIKVHPHAAGCARRESDDGSHKRGSTRNCIWPWLRMVCRSERLLRQVPQRIARLTS